MNTAVNFTEGTAAKERKRPLVLSVVTLALSLVSTLFSSWNFLDYFRLLSSTVGSNADPLLAELINVTVINAVFSLIQPLPAILLFLCVIRKSPKTLLCITFASVIVSPLVGLITSLSYGLEALVSFDTLLNLSLIATFVLATVSAAKGFKRTLSLKFAGCIYLFAQAVNLVFLSTSLNFILETKDYRSLLGGILSIVANVLFIIALYALAFQWKRTQKAPLPRESAAAEGDAPFVADP